MAVVAGLAAILLISGAVTVWASSSGPKPAMPAAWTAGPSAATTLPQHATVPVATGNRATSSTTASTTSRTTSAAATKTFPSDVQAPTIKITTGTGTLPACSGGRTVSTAVFTLKVPAGWTCIEQTSGNVALIAIYDESLDVIQVPVSPSTDVVTACGAYLATQSSSTVVAQPDTAWGGKTAKTAKVTVSSLTAQARCAESKGIIYMMVGAATGGTYESVVTAMGAVSSAWVWK